MIQYYKNVYVHHYNIMIVNLSYVKIALTHVKIVKKIQEYAYSVKKIDNQLKMRLIAYVYKDFLNKITLAINVILHANHAMAILNIIVLNAFNKMILILNY